MMNLKNKVIVVTGGLGLLGNAVVEEVILNKGIAIIADIDKEVGIEREKSLKQRYNTENVQYVYVDINRVEHVDVLISNILAEYGEINALINNAYPRNHNYGRNFFDVEYNDFCENINLNLGGYFLTCQRFLEYFIVTGNGNIINVASIYGVVAPRFDIYEGTNMTMPVEYAVIKSGIIHLTKYLAKYLKGKNISVNSISLGGLLNNQPKKFIKKYGEYCINKGMLDPSDIVPAFLFLLDENNRFINGQNLVIDDGFTL